MKKLILLVVLGFPIILIGQNALRFDGVNDYVELNGLAPSFAGLNNYTIEFWMQTDGTPQAGSFVGLFSLNAASPGDNRFMIMLGATDTAVGRLIIYDHNPSGGLFEIMSPQVINDGNCHHIAYVRNGSSGSAYVDGSFVGSHVVDHVPIIATDRISLGQEWDGTVTSDHYRGDFGELRVWNITRSAAQIQASMYSPLSGTENGLIAYYQFNQGTAGGNNAGITTLTNSVTSGVNGNLVNFALNGSNSNWVAGACEVIGLDEHNDTRLRVFPNPTDGIVILDPSSVPSSISVYDLSGRLFLTLYNQNSVDISSLAAGVYIVEVCIGDKIFREQVIRK